MIMASLLQGIKNWFRKKKDDAAKKLEDPVRDGQFAIEDSEKEIAEFRMSIGKYAGVVKQQEHKIDDIKAQVQKWAGIAEHAAVDGNVDDVRAALTEKGRQEQALKTCQVELDKNQAMLANIKSRYQDAQRKVEEAKSNFVQLEVRQESADLRKGLAASVGDVGNSSAFAKLDDLRTAVVANECEAEALEEMSDISQPSKKLEDKYSGSDIDVEAETAALMEKVKSKQATK
jgi:phage shock protein A